MEILVKVTNILEPLRFKSQKNGNEYTKHTFVCETGGQYPKKIAFSVMGDDRFRQMNIVVGNTYTVFFDVESREWNGKWFTEASCWKVQGNSGGGSGNNAPQQAPSEVQNPQPQAAPQATTDAYSDNLPF